MRYQAKHSSCPCIILPVHRKPLAATYASIANFLSILPSSGYEKEWLLNNLMIPLYVEEPETGPQYRFSEPLYRDCCFMKHHEFYRYRDMTPEQFLEFLYQALLHHTYIVARTNERYIPHTLVYQIADLSHRQLVYGMDWEKEIIYLMLHTNHRQYRSVSVSFSDFLQGFQALTEFKPLRLIRIQHSVPYSILWHNIACDFQVYLEGRIVPHEGKNVYFGIAAARQLMDYLHSVAAGKIELDIRMISAYVDHKQAVFRKLELLEEQGVGEGAKLAQAFRPIVELAEISQFRLLHYLSTPLLSDLESTVQHISAVCAMEEKLYPQFVRHVERKILKNTGSIS